MAADTWWRAWSVLALYVVVLYGLLPLGPTIGLGAIRTALGAWLLGPGLGVIGVAIGVALFVRLWRRGAPPWAYVALVLAGVCYTLVFTSLRAARLERTHLAEYGIAAWLAWRALVPSLGDRWPVYGAAWLLAAAIGWGDELVQSVTPGRYYDVRDIGANALGAGLGVLALAVWRSGDGASATQHGQDRADERHHQD